ncbi:Uncharacterised protein [Mycobacterium tuberculosis]|uniref:Uncharacterized protein n=1 Tax=Mycobacterium tuberculosis TaxID=1773 RepID=A0A916LI15_MYCTX|nr:Uncharacterised protein [Mycobacterium tuberculosis]CPB14928.1 Uncharacterised protein [Mycobacterium tuberculosis]
MVQTAQQRVEPVATSPERRGVRDDTQVAGAVTDLLGHPSEVGRRLATGNGQGCLESAEIPRLGSRH